MFRGWVGSVDLNDDSRFGHVDMVNAIRSPDQVLKPFVYGLALDEGLIHPASLLQDVPGVPVITDLATLTAVSWADQHDGMNCARAEFTSCAGAGSLWTETVCGKVTQCWIAVIFAPNGAA